MSEMCTVTKVNYGVIFLIFLFLLGFSLIRHKLFTNLESFENKDENKDENKNEKKESKKNTNTKIEKCPGFFDSISLIIINGLQGKFFPKKDDTKQKLKRQVKNIKQYCRYERVNILSKYYLLVLKDKLALF